MTTRLGIALPVRNGENYLRAALESVLAQTFGDFVLFASDNASDDATPDILADFARRDPRIRFSRTDESLPQQPNVNRAVELTPATWVHILCHDDLMQPDCLAQLNAVLDELEDGRVGLIGNGETYLFPNGSRSRPPEATETMRLSGRDTIVGVLSGSSSFALPALTTATVRKAAFDEIGGFSTRYRYFDTPFWLELLTRWDFAYIPAPLTTNRIHSEQVAAIAGKQLASVDDYRRFLPDFIGRHRDFLALPPAIRFRARLRPMGEAAVKIVGEAMSGRWAGAVRMLSHLPWFWQPMMPALCLRAWHREKARLAAMGDVPQSMVYP